MNPSPPSQAPQSRYLRCGGRELHYMEWGADQPETVIAWHGLARTGRDMDELAAHLCAQGYRVICPDTVGRGLSEWAQDPQAEYHLDAYAGQAADLLLGLGIERAHWVGTSMGGAIGMVCAAGRVQPVLKDRVISLVLNDNAPALAQTAIERIKAYAGHPPAFRTVGELETFFRTVYAPYGWLSDEQWRRLTETSARRLPDGRLTPHYDPAMVQQFIHHPNDYVRWQDYDALALPVLLLRGEHSDLVLRDTVDTMRQRGPGARGQLTVIEVPGCGHAPALNVPAQLGAVLAFIRAHSAG